MSEDRTQTVAPQHPEVAKALENITIHTRVTDQGLAPEGEELEEMVGRVPVLAPFGSNPYAGVVAVLVRGPVAIGLALALFVMEMTRGRSRSVEK